jgi:hypothetical protein
MQSFVSRQTYALRSSTRERFGFALVPHLAVAAETLAVAERLAAAIKGSETDASGACGAAGESCSRCRTPPSATSSSSSGSTSEARSSSISPTPSTGTLATASSSLAHLRRGGDRRATAWVYTVAPASASTIATARPAPRLAPVTTPTTPASSTVKVFIDVMIFGGNYRPTAPAGANSTSFVLGRIHCEPG